MSKLKELHRRSTVAWSVATAQPDLLAVGTVAGTIGLDFDTSAQLEIFSIGLQNSTNELTPLGTTQSSNRFHKIVWGQSGNGKHGILAGGMDNGSVTIWDPAKIIAGGDEEPCLGTVAQHTGPVQALDFNPFQQNLLASGATESEIFIWDLSSPTNPTVYSPGARPPGLAVSDVSSVAWNKKVQHILASTMYSGLTVIWDLKAKRPVLNITDKSSKARPKAMAWNPQEATQIVTASEEDEAPVLQMWDLRNVYTPVRTFNGHTRGVWGVSWSPYDNSLLLSCGKDNRTLCWQAETGELLCEVESGTDTNVWNFDVQWSPRIPAILSTSSLEGKISIYALQDVCERVPQNQVDSSGLGLIQANQATPRAPVSLKHTPGWLQRPCGVAFGFGGKLVSFSRAKDAPTAAAPAGTTPGAAATPAVRSSNVRIKRVVTEQDMLARSERLEQVINANQFVDFCNEKISHANNDEEESTWKFLRVLFEEDARSKILGFLGFDEEKRNKEITEAVNKLPRAQGEEEEEIAAVSSPVETKLSKKLSDLDLAKQEKVASEEEEDEVKEDTEVKTEEIGGVTDEEEKPLVSDDSIQQDKDVAGLFGSGHDSAFETFSFQQPEKSAEGDKKEPFAAPVKTELKEEVQKPKKPVKPIEFFTEQPGPESAITKALVIGNFEAAVQCCIRMGRMADALILAASGGPALWAKTQEAYFALQAQSYTGVMSAVVRSDLEEMVNHAVLSDWKATLATLCTYTKSTEFPRLCSALGDRLDTESRDVRAAILCYICAGSVDKAVQIWVRSANTRVGKNSHQELQDLIEKVSIFRHAVGLRDDLNDLLALKYSEYAAILAAQGRTSAALRYLNFLNDPKYTGTSGAVLLDRVYNSSAQPKEGVATPAFPFKREQIGPTAPVRAPAAQVTTPTRAGTPPQFSPSHPHAHAGAIPGGNRVGPPPTVPTFTGVQQPWQQHPHEAHPHTHPHTHPVHPPPPAQGHVHTPPQGQFPPPPAVQTPPSVPGSGFSTLPPSVPGPGFAPVRPPTIPTQHNVPSFTPAAPHTNVVPPPYTSNPPPPSVPAVPTVPTVPTVPSVPRAIPTGPFGSTAPSMPPVSVEPFPPPVAPFAVPPPVVQTQPGAAPPPSAVAPPPPAAGNPVTATPPAAAKPAAAPAPPAAPSAETKHVIESLNQLLASTQGPAARSGASNKQKWDDCSKRIAQLVAKLEEARTKPEAVASLSQICDSLLASDAHQAQQIFIQLSTGPYSGEIAANLMIGLKRLIELAKLQ